MDNKFNHKKINDTSCLIYTGDVLDNSNADLFSSLIMEYYTSEISLVTIDMKELEFLSSAGIGSILGTIELFREKGGDIELINLNEKIVHILEVLNLKEYLTIHSSSDIAINS